MPTSGLYNLPRFRSSRFNPFPSPFGEPIERDCGAFPRLGLTLLGPGVVRQTLHVLWTAAILLLIREFNTLESYTPDPKKTSTNIEKFCWMRHRWCVRVRVERDFRQVGGDFRIFEKLLRAGQRPTVENELRSRVKKKKYHHCFNIKVRLKEEIFGKRERYTQKKDIIVI